MAGRWRSAALTAAASAAIAAALLLRRRRLARRAQRGALACAALAVGDSGDSGASGDSVGEKARGARAPVFAGAYPRGFGEVALAEVKAAGGTIIPGGHLEAHAVILFRVEGVKDGTFIELGAFTWLFELLARPPAVAWPPPSAAALRSAVRAAVAAAPGGAAAWRGAVRKPWRATCVRAMIGTPGDIKSPAIEREVAAAVGENLIEPGCEPPPVSLEAFELEVVVFLSDGIDTVAQARAAGKPPSHVEATLLLGLRRAEGALVRLARLGAVKGEKVLSRASDAVAFCVAYRAARLVASLPASASKPPSVDDAVGVSLATLVTADPMCGVGTFLLALRWVLLRAAAGRQTLSYSAVELLGSDADAAAVEQARANAKDDHAEGSVEINFANESVSEWADRMQKRGGVDLVIVDPPWGQRHSNFSQVMKNMNAWARDWARALKPGGVALVVTIRTKQFEKEVVDNLQYRNLLWLEEAVQFDNKGYAQCKLYVLRQPGPSDAP